MLALLAIGAAGWQPKRLNIYWAAMRSTAAFGISSNLSLNLGDFLSVGSTMKVQTTVKNDFELRYGSSHEAEYNLKIAIKATAAKTPLGIERLLGIAEKIATNNEQANSKLAAAK